VPCLYLSRLLLSSCSTHAAPARLGEADGVTPRWCRMPAFHLLIALLSLPFRRTTWFNVPPFAPRRTLSAQLSHGGLAATTTSSATSQPSAVKRWFATL